MPIRFLIDVFEAPFNESYHFLFQGFIHKCWERLCSHNGLCGDFIEVDELIKQPILPILDNFFYFGSIGNMQAFEILEDFFYYRFEMYEKRKADMVKRLK